MGSKLSLKEDIYNQIINNSFRSKYIIWNQKLDSLSNINETNSHYASEISDSINTILKDVPQFELQYAIKIANLYGYSKFLKILQVERNSKIFKIDTLTKYCNLFQQKFINHPYNEIAQFRINGLLNIRVGSVYVDFTAQDSTDKNYTLSDIVSKNKLTLIDFWAPWCGSCIGKNKKEVPIYQNYKELGFEITGIVGSINNQEQFIKAIEKPKYPWLLLSEIDNRNKLWDKYNISNLGGGQFLVNNKGIILAINPTPDELIKLILNE